MATALNVHAKQASLPLLAPTAGLLAQFLDRWYGPDYRGTLDIIADIDARVALSLVARADQLGCPRRRPDQPNSIVDNSLGLSSYRSSVLSATSHLLRVDRALNSG